VQPSFNKLLQQPKVAGCAKNDVHEAAVGDCVFASSSKDSQTTKPIAINTVFAEQDSPNGGRSTLEERRAAKAALRLLLSRDVSSLTFHVTDYKAPS
jgi:hypothetical protein